MGKYYVLWEHLRDLDESEREARRHETESDSDADILMLAAKRLIATGKVTWDDVHNNALQDIWPYENDELWIMMCEYKLTEHDIDFVRAMMLGLLFNTKYSFQLHIVR